MEAAWTNVSSLHLVQQVLWGQFSFRSQVCIHASRTFLSTGLVQQVFCMSQQLVLLETLLDSASMFFVSLQTSPGSFCFHTKRGVQKQLMCHHDNLTSAHPPASCGCSLFVTCWCSSRWAPPDLHKLNEDGELWLVNQGLKGTVRWFPLASMTAVHSLLHPSTPPSVFSAPAVCAGARAESGAGWSCCLLLARLSQVEGWVRESYSWSLVDPGEHEGPGPEARAQLPGSEAACVGAPAQNLPHV